MQRGAHPQHDIISVQEGPPSLKGFSLSFLAPQDTPARICVLPLYMEHPRLYPSILFLGRHIVLFVFTLIVRGPHDTCWVFSQNSRILEVFFAAHGTGEGKWIPSKEFYRQVRSLVCDKLVFFILCVRRLSLSQHSFSVPVCCLVCLFYYQGLRVWFRSSFIACTTSPDARSVCQRVDKNKTLCWYVVPPSR